MLSGAHSFSRIAKPAPRLLCETAAQHEADTLDLEVPVPARMQPGWSGHGSSFGNG